MARTKRDWVEESDYWGSLSIEQLIEMSEPDEDVKFIDARPKKAISLRLTESLIQRGKEAASEMGNGYQMWIIEGLKRHKLQKLEEAAARKRRSA